MYDFYSALDYGLDLAIALINAGEDEETVRIALAYAYDGCDHELAVFDTKVTYRCATKYAGFF